MNAPKALCENTMYKYYDFSDLPQNNKIIAEYLWIDGSGQEVRSKSRTLDKKITKLDQLPEWNFDGSSTNQATTANSEVIMKPVAFYPDPFRRGDNILVMCETFVWSDAGFKELKPANSNFRHFATQVFDKCKDEHPWYGIEQEYTLFNRINTGSRWPIGWPSGGFPGPQGPYYCSVGATNCFGRAIMEAHYKACLYAGLKISGTNAEVMPGQWEFQIGPSEGIDIGDHLWVARYLLGRVAEDFNISISIDPKPVKGDWNGAGGHTNFSTEAMRNEGGIKVIYEAIEKLSKRHKEHIRLYGEGNEQRLTGKHETSSIDDFSSAIGHRGASIRIPTNTGATGKGYFEDRRPASNLDPYLVAAMIADTVCLNGTSFVGGVNHFNTFIDLKKGMDFAGRFH